MTSASKRYKNINQTGRIGTCVHLALQHSIPVKLQKKNKIKGSDWTSSSPWRQGPPANPLDAIHSGSQEKPQPTTWSPLPRLSTHTYTSAMKHVSCKNTVCWLMNYRDKHTHLSYIGTTHDDKKQNMEASKADAFHSILNCVAFRFCVGYKHQNRHRLDDWKLLDKLHCTLKV